MGSPRRSSIASYSSPASLRAFVSRSSNASLVRIFAGDICAVLSSPNRGGPEPDGCTGTKCGPSIEGVPLEAARSMSNRDVVIDDDASVGCDDVAGCGGMSVVDDAPALLVLNNEATEGEYKVDCVSLIVNGGDALGVESCTVTREEAELDAAVEWGMVFCAFDGTGAVAEEKIEGFRGCAYTSGCC